MENLNFGNSTDNQDSDGSNLLILILFLLSIICCGSINYMKNERYRNRQQNYNNPIPVRIPIPIPLNEELPRYENIEGPPSYDSIT